MIKLIFLIRDLNTGGSQKQLTTLVKALDKKKFEITVLTFYSGGVFEKDLHDTNVNLISLSKTSRWDVWGFLGELIRTLSEVQPDIIHGYLSLPNVLTMLLKPLFPKTKMIWGVRCSDRNLSRYDWLSKASFQLESRLSPLADLIIVNSHTGKSYHIDYGFPSKKMVVIPNGIDTEYFKPAPDGRIKVRKEWGISEDRVLIGLVGRLNPIKDHATFLEAANLLLEQRDDVHFVCVGSGSETYTETLHQLADKLGISEQVIWAGARDDMPAVYNSLDIACCCSYGEGFPNVVGEAMACGIPCVVTDVGDSAWIVRDTGIVVPPKNPLALAKAWKSCMERDNQEISLQSRLRIIEHFSVQELANQTEKLLEKLS
ncbi:MAG: glycosyltransferase [Crocosphaera sp.]|uniref:glycosyltransferase n=1 Tax=Crocosphaera sp. TaxID=2729996 RepID=UPI0025901DD9|nr:glycosyltransferase [Crocosphaera sp.]MCH2244479.1 glycosyltransferase [Crocosphaera sp.]